MIGESASPIRTAADGPPSPIAQLATNQRQHRSPRSCYDFRMAARDHELEVLLNLDGFEFEFARGYAVKIAVQLAETTSGRPHGIKYSLTLHDLAGQRIYGLDNAHRIRRSRTAFDHRHIYGARRIIPYIYRGPVELLQDFYREVERILRERGAL